MRRLLSVLLTLVLVTALTAVPSFNVAAAENWPVLDGIEAESGILIDGRTGAVLYEKNADDRCYPASITKILTALIVIENCDLEEEFTFSHRAIYDVEENSQNAGYREGDTVTVRTALYALLLQSANEVANGLAEHCAGSMEDFVTMMNDYAHDLGCRNTHFANPSGLNNEYHYTTASDFALICRKAFSNDIFCMIDGTTYYKLPPMKILPEGYEIYTHHSMIKKSNALYYDGAVGGKTGYTSLAGNTLVTCAERENLRLIAIVLNGHHAHYTDTKKMLDFGFENFKSVDLRDYENAFDHVFNVLDITGTGIEGRDALFTDKGATITLPKDASIKDTETSISYDIKNEESANAVAKIEYTYAGRDVGSDYIYGNYAASETEIIITQVATEETEVTPIEKARSFFRNLPLFLSICVAGAIGIVALIVMLAMLINNYHRKREEQENYIGSYDPGKSRRRH